MKWINEPALQVQHNSKPVPYWLLITSYCLWRWGLDWCWKAAVFAFLVLETWANYYTNSYRITWFLLGAGVAAFFVVFFVRNYQAFLLGGITRKDAGRIVRAGIIFSLPLTAYYLLPSILAMLTLSKMPLSLDEVHAHSVMNAAIFAPGWFIFAILRR